MWKVCLLTTWHIVHGTLMAAKHTIRVFTLVWHSSNNLWFLERRLCRMGRVQVECFRGQRKSLHTIPFQVHTRACGRRQRQLDDWPELPQATGRRSRNARRVDGRGCMERGRRDLDVHLELAFERRRCWDECLDGLRRLYGANAGGLRRRLRC